MSTDPEVRREPRLALDIAVRIINQAGTITHGRAHDFSRTGISFYGPVELNEGDTVRLMFTLPSSRMKMEVNAVVRNRNGFRYGVQFSRLAALEKAEIDRIAGILALIQH